MCQQILEKNHERKKHMKTITKCIYAEIAVFAFACFAIAQSAQAQRGNGDTRTFVIRFETHVLNCAPEIVQGAGRVRLKFGVNRAFEVVPSKYNYKKSEARAEALSVSISQGSQI